MRHPRERSQLGERLLSWEAGSGTRDVHAAGCVACGGPLTGRREADERVWAVFDRAPDHTASSLWPPVR